MCLWAGALLLAFGLPTVAWLMYPPLVYLFTVWPGAIGGVMAAKAEGYI